MRNWQRWALTFATAFLGGMIECAADTKPQALSDYVRHGLIGMVPAVMALKLTLNEDEK